jgi:hypothetical protein
MKNSQVLLKSMLDVARAAKPALEIVFEREQGRLDKVIAGGEEMLKQ